MLLLYQKKDGGDSPRNGFTLFEVLIALGLMTVVLSLVLFAVNVHLTQLVVNRTEVEEAQLARAILESIAKDIRNVIVSAQETEQTATASSTEEGEASEEEEEEEEEETTEEIYGTKPGIYGDLTWIQIDTARLPRGEMFGSKQVRNGLQFVDRLSPSKTVLYYQAEELTVRTPEQEYEIFLLSPNRSMMTPFGLLRRQLDRMVSQYAVNEGLETEYEQYDEPFAPEVEWIEFSYYTKDSSATSSSTSTDTESESSTTSTTSTQGEWLNYWDMDEKQKLPLAVKITVAIRRQLESKLDSKPNEEAQPIIYSLVVPIPVSVER
jgi:prepilin-type N-terminal cleavage/methylation domain-containing protein